jgi:hypothetical protein
MPHYVRRSITANFNRIRDVEKDLAELQLQVGLCAALSSKAC